MVKYHINPATGNAGACRATRGGCPFGGAEEHHGSPEEARAAFEAAQQTFRGAKVTPRLHTTMAHVEPGNFIHLENGESGQVIECYPSGGEVVVEIESQSGDGRRFARLSLTLLPTTAVQVERAHATLKQVRMAEGRHPLSRSEGAVNRAHQLARDATNWKGGDRVLDARSAGEAAELLVKNSAVAEEVRQACEREGWVTEVVHLQNTEHKLLRVTDLASTRRCFAFTKNLNWHPESNSFTAEASELRDFSVDDLTLVSQKDGSTVKMEHVATLEDDREYETLAWRFRPVGAPEGSWTLTVFNT